MCGCALIRCLSADRQQLPEQRRLPDGTAATPIKFRHGSTVRPGDVMLLPNRHTVRKKKTLHKPDPDHDFRIQCPHSMGTCSNGCHSTRTKDGLRRRKRSSPLSTNGPAGPTPLRLAATCCWRSPYEWHAPTQHTTSCSLPM